MDKRSPLPGGWPDFTLAYQGIPIAIECKTVAGALRPEQQQCLAKMEQNGWTILIARDLAAAGPYLIANAPVPVRDSHPNCRCALVTADID